MAKSKLIVADPASGKSTMYELSDDQFRAFRGLKIGSEVEGSTVGVEGNIKITGGSDSAGFPMRPDVQGGVKKHVLMTNGVGFRSKDRGLKRRKMVRGNTITEEIYQINSVLIAKPKQKAAKKAKAKEAPEAAKKKATPSEAKPSTESTAEAAPDKSQKEGANPPEKVPEEAPKPAEEKAKAAPKETPEPAPETPDEASEKTG